MTTNISEIRIPVAPPVYPRVKRDYPISEGENLMLALRHEKPKWMPNFEASCQIAPAGSDDDAPNAHEEDYTDWFGVFRKWEPAQASTTPVGRVFDSIDEWKERTEFPDLDGLDWHLGYDAFARDDDLALYTRLNGGVFQRIHAMEGFENALVDLITKPKQCREFFEAMIDFQIEVFRRKNDVYHFDFILYHDDWGTSRAPFFSTDLLKQTILPPTVRLFEAIGNEGVIPLFHNCGMINDFVPYLVDEIGAAGLEIQPINDIDRILKEYGDRCTVEYTRPDPYFFFDPATTTEMVKAKAREIVDRYGAHVNEGAGVMTSIIAPNEDIYYTFDEEMYRYSLDRYRNL
jgi:hypothetical protein